MAFDLDEEELKATRKMNKVDRDEIEVNEYVRLARNQGINKIIDKEDDRYILESEIADSYGDITWFLYECELKDEIVKHSKQLIDLIEVKDVIKYRIDNISTTLETKGYVEGIVDISDEEMLQRIKSDKNYHILEILTKESYIANCYKVGEEDE